MSVGYAKLIDKARKLKALADRGNGGEMDTAKRFYKKFIFENKILETEIQEDYFKRTFNLVDTEYEILLSHVIMSVNPFTEIKRNEVSRYFVNLDDEDYIEVQHKFSVFHGHFKKYENSILGYVPFQSKEEYNKAKFLMLSSFLFFYQKHFEPDLYSVQKERGKEGIKVNPIMKDKVNETAKETKRKKVFEQKEIIESNAEQPRQFDYNEINLIQRFSQFFKKINYVRANKSISAC